MNPSPKVIDIYHADSVSSFEAIYKAGIRGVIHKATEGNTLTDFAYAERREVALDEGLLWGAYHFLRPGDMEGQARRFVDTAAPTEATLLAADHEDGKVSLLSLLEFMHEVHNEVGRFPLLYSGFLIKEQIATAHVSDKGAFRLTRLWLAQYATTPKWPSAIWGKPFLWQYTGNGKIDGISGHVDLNSFDGTDEELAAQWAGVSAKVEAV
jgi:lysozyme